MDLAHRVGQAVELVEEAELYGHERELTLLVLRGEFSQALASLADIVRREYQLLPGVSPTLTLGHKKHRLALARLQAELVNLVDLQQHGKLRPAPAMHPAAPVKPAAAKPEPVTTRQS